MKRLLLKIFLACAALAILVAGAAALVAQPGAFSFGSFVLLLGLALCAAALLAHALGHRTLAMLDDVHAFAHRLREGRRSSRLAWSFSDERDRAAAALNRMAERLASEIETAQSEAQRLEAVMASMVEGVLLVDPNDRVLLINPGFRELFEVWGPIEERSLVEVIRLPEIHALLRDAREATKPVIRDVRLRGANERTLLAHATRFPTEGAPAGTLAVFHDVTPVRRVDQVRRDFIANASHELRTPLTSIQGYAETLAGGGLAPEDAERCLATILRNVSRMRALIEDLMELSRIENEASARERTRVDLIHLTRELFVDLAKRLSSHEIEARLITATAPAAWGDRVALQRVLENLLTNAIRYSDAGGTIEVSVETKGDLLEVTVADQGIGIPEEARDRIFERFYRVDAARSRAVGSTGLGLSIVRHLVQAMGGTIRLESEVDVGSRFIFSVPRAPGESAERAEAAD